MKKSEIVVGKMYTNGEGKIRKVIAEGPEYVLYESQMETDNLRYEIINDGTKKNNSCGLECNSTRTSFAHWAKSEVK